jgi:hypothetical protein
LNQIGPQTELERFLQQVGNFNAETSDVLKDKSVILPEPFTNTKHLVPQDLMIFHQNIRSLNNKINEILNTTESNPTTRTLFY